PTKRAGVPLWMEAAVTKMLAKDPENRFATTTRMVEALRRGLETGEVMEDEIARRRESIPPPSVSRVMQKMGLTTPAEFERSQPLPVAPAPAPAPAPQPVAERRRTGTPELGVPVGPVPAAVAGAIEAPVAKAEPPVVTAPKVEAPKPPVVEAAAPAGRPKRDSSGGPIESST